MFLLLQELKIKTGVTGQTDTKEMETEKEGNKDSSESWTEWAKEKIGLKHDDDPKDAAKEAAKRASDSATDATRRASDAAKETTKKASDTAADTTRKASDTAKKAYDTAADTTKKAYDTAAGTAKDAAKKTYDTAADTAKATKDTACGNYEHPFISYICLGFRFSINGDDVLIYINLI